ncbi:hypothetical protein [Streptomyces piniterrae]|uniref:hypothetical protein n=1 Tax=Streptomyces piniterrae TaxID=2571125 RepID=UPI00145DE799|nr:hypothetical protein [Streptomyces piniterrae]
MGQSDRAGAVRGVDRDAQQGAGVVAGHQQVAGRVPDDAVGADSSMAQQVRVAEEQ